MANLDLKRNEAFNTVATQGKQNSSFKQTGNRNLKETKEFPIIDHVKRNIEKAKVSLIPNREQILKEGGLPKWHRTRR